MSPHGLEILKRCSSYREWARTHPSEALLQNLPRTLTPRLSRDVVYFSWVIGRWGKGSVNKNAASFVKRLVYRLTLLIIQFPLYCVVYLSRFQTVRLEINESGPVLFPVKSFIEEFWHHWQIFVAKGMCTKPVPTFLYMSQINYDLALMALFWDISLTLLLQLFICFITPAIIVLNVSVHDQETNDTHCLITLFLL